MFIFQFVRPTRQTFISVYQQDGGKIYSVDVSSSLDISYPSWNDLTLTINTPSLVIQEKQSYYIMMDPGIAKGTELCGPESSAIRDMKFWTFSVSKYSTLIRMQTYFKNSPLISKTEDKPFC